MSDLGIFRAPVHPPDPALSHDAALRLVVEGTVSETGVGFFRALVRNLAAAMGTAGAWVTEYHPAQKRLHAYAFWLEGRFIEDFQYPIAGTACEPVVEEKRLVHIPDRLLELYPHDPEAVPVPVPAVSYLGVPLLDTDGEVMGHLSVLDTKPFPPAPRLLSLFEIFAARAAAEQRRLRQELEVRAREQELTALLDGAMDAVLVLDEDGALRRANPAAEQLFGGPEQTCAGRSFRELLTPESATRFAAFLAEIEARPEGRRHLWIPRSFTGRRRDGTVFPADATLSRFTNRGRVYHTVILRNIDERLAAERRIESLTVQTAYLEAEIRALHNHGEIVGQSPALRQVLREVEQVAVTDAAVLLEGETGTGKELFARAIHAASHRRDRPLVTVNCAAIPSALIESEFFGHEKGAFTGATARREGRFALADGGTIFLDEIGELPLELQSKLLRILQEGTFEPVGSATTRSVDVRIIAATNRDLAQEAAANRFRPDLFYRLSVFPLRLPPLRERPEDIPALATTFAQRHGRRLGRTLHPLGPEEMTRLQHYAWPGNVRELQNVIERAVITSTDGRLNLARALPEAPSLAPTPTPAPTPPPPAPGETGIRTLHDLRDLERRNLQRALESAEGRISGAGGAAELLGMHPSTLRSRLKALGLAPPARTPRVD